MLAPDAFEGVVARACLAPSTHNTQPARWALRGEEILIGADAGAYLPVGDPTARDAGLSCGAAAEATVLALSAMEVEAAVSTHWNDEDLDTLGGARLAARLRLETGGEADPLHVQLENRFTWRGVFGAGPDLQEWNRPDAKLVTDQGFISWLATLNDEVSHEIMGGAAFRHELLAWMRLNASHPRYTADGLSREALRMSGLEAFAAPVALGPLWRLLASFGLSKRLTSEAEATLTAPVIACFHRPANEDAVASGRAYLRMCLEAASLGLAGWPMAALSDHPRSNAQICERLGLPDGNRLIQMIRFGIPTGQRPPRARRPLAELIL